LGSRGIGNWGNWELGNGGNGENGEIGEIEEIEEMGGGGLWGLEFLSPRQHGRGQLEYAKTQEGSIYEDN
jgi:hypothetical protein